MNGFRRSWPRSALPAEVAQRFEASAIAELRGLRVLGILPGWTSLQRIGSGGEDGEFLVLCRNGSALSALAVSAIRSQTFGDPYRVLARHMDGAITAAQEFGAGTAVMLVHSFCTQPRLLDEFERFCLGIGAKASSSSLWVSRPADASQLVLALCDGQPQARPPARMADFAMLAMPPF